MDTNSESETNDLLISDLIINFNKLVLEGQSFYRSRERTLALEKYNQALLLAEKMRDPEKIAYLKTNIAIVDFENGEYKACLLQLEDAFSLLSSLNKGELLNELKIKLLSSLCVINIVLNHLEKAKEYGSKITNLLMNLTPIARKPAMELVVFSLYKFMNFPSMNEISLEGVEEICKKNDYLIFFNA